MQASFLLVLAVLCAEASGQTTLKRCDSSKIALTSVPYLVTPAADACGAEALGGKSIRSIFETSVTSPDTIAKMVNTPSCQTWWKEMSAPFASFKPCMYLGMTIQDFSKLSLQAFLDANNKEIQSFDPNRPADNSPIETDDGDAPPLSPSDVPTDAPTDAPTTPAPTTTLPTTTLAPATTTSTTSAPKVTSATTALFHVATWCSVAAAIVMNI